MEYFMRVTIKTCTVSPSVADDNLHSPRMAPAEPTTAAAPLRIIAFPMWQGSRFAAGSQSDGVYLIQLTVPTRASHAIAELSLLQKGRPDIWESETRRMIKKGVKLAGNSTSLLHGTLGGGSALELIIDKAREHWSCQANRPVELFLVHMSHFFDTEGAGALDQAIRITNARDYITHMQLLQAPLSALPRRVIG